MILPLWVAFLGAQITTGAGKYAIDRQRPVFIEEVGLTTPSFPSGHATGAMAVYGFLAYAIARGIPSGRARFETVFWCGALIVLVGFSRIYLSAHYLTDVAAGFLVGGFWLAVAFAIAEWRLDVRWRSPKLIGHWFVYADIAVPQRPGWLERSCNPWSVPRTLSPRRSAVVREQYARASPVMS